MKSKTLVEWMFTPFKYIAGGKALLIGVAVMALVSVLGYLSGVHFDGVLDIHFSLKGTYLVHALYQVTTWFILLLVLYITARIMSKSEVRIIDLAGTIAVSQAPLILMALCGFIPAFHLDFGDMSDLDELMVTIKDNIGMIVLNAIVGLVFIAWTIILRYNAYSVSANLKGSKAIVSFVIALFISEILSKIVLSLTVPLLS